MYFVRFVAGKCSKIRFLMENPPRVPHFGGKLTDLDLGLDLELEEKCSIEKMSFVNDD